MPLAREAFRASSPPGGDGAPAPAPARGAEERDKDQDRGRQGPKKLKPDPSQPSVADFFGGRARDKIPSKCDEWDRKWDEGTEGLEFKSERKRDGTDSSRAEDEDARRFEAETDEKLAFWTKGEKRGKAEADGEAAESRGICRICLAEVKTFQLRFREDDGNYVHKECGEVASRATTHAEGKGYGACEHGLGCSEGGGGCQKEDGSSDKWVAVSTVAVPADAAGRSKANPGPRKQSAFAPGGAGGAGGSGAGGDARANADSTLALEMQQKEYEGGSAFFADKKWRRPDAFDKAPGGKGAGGVIVSGPQFSGQALGENLASILGQGYIDVWDRDHVRLPCSRFNVSFTDQSSRWLKIRRALLPRGGIHKVSDLISAITGYMGKPQKGRRWTFRALESLVDNWYDTKERRAFFETTLPFIIKSALALPARCPQPIPLLRAGSSAAVNLSSLQIVSLLANAFLCTFPEARDQDGKHARKFPRINFCVLFEAPEKPWNRGSDPVPQHTQKILCILNYFQRQAARPDHELARSIVTIHRRAHDQGRDWAQSTASMARTKLATDINGRIEDFDDADQDGWEADFANCLVGGGVLASGCVQEEIRFLLSPELLVSLLLTQRLGDLENLLITGSERFNSYTGYASSFQFSGNFADNTSKEALLTAGAPPLHTAEYRRKSTITAMDAIHFGPGQYASQFQMENIRRELDKAFVAFQVRDSSTLSGASSGGIDLGPVDAATTPWVRTGNWGCGAFGGDLILKAVIQLVAAAEAGRNLRYFVFGDDELSMQSMRSMASCVTGMRAKGAQSGRFGERWRSSSLAGLACLGVKLGRSSVIFSSSTNGRQRILARVKRVLLHAGRAAAQS